MSRRTIAPRMTKSDALAVRLAIAERLARLVLEKTDGMRCWAVINNMELVRALAAIDRSLGGKV